MQKTMYDLNAKSQKRISNFSLVKTILINLGFVFKAITLIILGINLITDYQDDTLVIALPISLLLTISCFLTIILVNYKLRELRSTKLNKAKRILTYS